MISLIDHIKTMNFDQLLSLRAIIESGSFRGAGESLHKAQSAISSSIKNLEAEIGFQLFDRKNYRPRLTPQGEVFYRNSLSVLEKIKELQQLSEFLKLGYEPELRLIVSALVPMQILTTAIAKTQKEFPRTQIRIQQDVLSADESLQERTVDLALSEVESVSLHFKTQTVLTVAMLPVCATRHFGDKKQLEALIQRKPQITLASTGKERMRQVGVLDSAHVLSVSDFSTKKTLLLQGIGWGYMPEHLVKTELKAGILKLLPLQKLYIPIRLYSAHQSGPALQFFEQSFLQACGKEKIGKN